MTNFIKDNTVLEFPKVNRKAVPVGQEEKYISAADWNELCQGATDARDWLRAAEWYGLSQNASDPLPVGVANYIWLKNDGSLWKTINGVASQVGGAAGVGTINNGATGAIPKYVSGTTIDDSQITDDGTSVSLSRLRVSETVTYPTFVNLTLGTGPLDVDRAANGMFVVVTPDVAGTTIRSFKPVGGTTNYGERLVIYNAGNSISPKDYLILLTQDDPAGTFAHFHLGGRQPWLIIPPLESAEFHLNPADGKWHNMRPGDLALAPRPIPITTAVMASGNVNDFNPSDLTTGMSHKFATWIQCQPVSGTRLTGFDVSITAGANASRRILLHNFSVNNAVIAHNNSSGGTSTKPFFCPGGVDFTWRARAAVWAIYDWANNIWHLEGA